MEQNEAPTEPGNSYWGLCYKHVTPTGVLKLIRNKLGGFVFKPRRGTVFIANEKKFHGSVGASYFRMQTELFSAPSHKKARSGINQTGLSVIKQN